MSVCALELNDAGLLLGDDTQVLAESPGYALLMPSEIVVGDAARARARLEPRQAVSQFWQRLGTEPLPHAPRHARHHADLAYAHLLQVHESGGRPAELVLAVPGSFSREQLAILLGVAARCPFRAIGLVDSALAAAASAPLPAGELLHLDIQLHQCVLTRLTREQGTLVRGTVRTLSGVGLVALTERWARRAAALFIQQTRFDPLHAAAVEQQLYERLPEWLAALQTHEDVAAELVHGSARHTARLRATEMLDCVQPQYAQLREALLAENGATVHLLGFRLAALPRFAAQLPGAVVLPRGAALHGALRHLGQVRSEAPALRFVTRLPAPPVDVAPVAGQAPAEAPAPTHLVLGDRAWRLPAGESFLVRAHSGEWRLSRNRAPAPPACTLRCTGDACWLDPSVGQGLLLDGLAVQARVRVGSGARLRLADGPEMQFLSETVADGDGT